MKPQSPSLARIFFNMVLVLAILIWSTTAITARAGASQFTVTSDIRAYHAASGYLLQATSDDVGVPALPITRFAVIGDFGDGSSDEASVAGLVNGWNPDFIITTGDNRYGSMDFDQTVGQFYCDYLAGAGNGIYCAGGSSASNSFFPSLGNHDYKDGKGLNEYLDYFDLPGSGVTTSGTSNSELYYDFVQGPVHFFLLDSQGAKATKSDMMAQKNWLQSQLAASSAPWQVVYFHHPPYSSGKHGSATEMQWPYAVWGADAVIAGHDHNYERVLMDGIAYFVNGLGGKSIRKFGSPVSGSQVRYNSNYGAMLVDASDSAIIFQYINTSGEVIDTHTVAVNGPPSFVSDRVIKANAT